MLFRFIPYFRFPDIFFTIIRIPFRKMIRNIFFYAKYRQTMFCQCQTSFKFIYHLIRTDDQMSFGDRKLANTCQPMHFSGIFISE